MLGQRLAVILGGVLMCFSGALFAAPDTEAPGADSQSWGDPEEREEAPEGWTWFGMGYESRAWSAAGSRAQAADTQSEADSGGQRHSGGNGRHRRHGKN